MTRLAADVAREALANAAMAVPTVRSWRLKRPRADAHHMPQRRLLERYAFQPLRGIENVTGSVAGLDIIEFGPGDTLGSGLALLAAGARSYHALDRFQADYRSARARTRYLAIRAAWDDAFPDRRWPQDLSAADFPGSCGERVRIHPESVETLSTVDRFDVVTSWQVGEHVRDLATFAEQTARLLRPHGVAVHRVDFGPHAWQRYEDPLHVLRFPALLWQAMGSNRGVQNRCRHHEFVEAFERRHLTVECRDLHCFDPTMISFGKLSRRVRTMPRESLLVRDVVYVCRHSTG